MSRTLPLGLVLLLCFVELAVAGEPITVKTDVSQPIWLLPKPETVRMEFVRWLEAILPEDEAAQQNILATWPEAEGTLSGEQLFQQVVRAMATASPSVAAFLQICDELAWKESPFGQPVHVPQIPLQALVGDEKSTAYLVGSLRFYLVLRLIQARLYDEAATVLDQLTPENSVDPCGVLLHRAVVCSQFDDREKGITAIKLFQKTAEQDVVVPRRYLELAKLLEADFQNSPKEDENPANISRKMDDVRRRLGKGRTDDDTQEAEEDVLKSLDKLIEKIEQQMQQRQQAEGDEGQQANNPADDSRILKQKGPGNIDRKEFDPGDNWGDLPPKEREETLLRIEQDFPAHYRDIIEQYFREMASRPE